MSGAWVGNVKERECVFGADTMRITSDNFLLCQRRKGSTNKLSVDQSLGCISFLSLSVERVVQVR